jgi:hypothetical protein
MSGSRVVAVSPERLTGWVERFAKRHGEPTWEVAGERLALTSSDGARAEFVLPAPEGPAPAGLDELVAEAHAFRDFGLVLVRRGGYAVGLVRDGMLSGSRCGTRYVQGQTKAGGWSQQRFARRRANQADALTDAASQAVRDVLGEALRRQHLRLVCGGDQPLLTACLRTAGAGLSVPDLTALVLAHRLDVPDPRRKVLEEAVQRARAVRVRLNDLA